jgi:hypothetical protein
VREKEEVYKEVCELAHEDLDIINIIKKLRQCSHDIKCLQLNLHTQDR